MVIERATLSDAQEILALQRLAYESEADIYNDYTIEPLVQSLENIQSQFEEHVFIKCVFAGEIIGSVRGILKGGTCYIGKLMVHPVYQNKGIGKKLMSEIESVFCTAFRYELFTGSKSKKNISLYIKVGYKSFNTKIITSDLSMVFFDKYNDQSLKKTNFFPVIR